MNKRLTFGACGLILMIAGCTPAAETPDGGMAPGGMLSCRNDNDCAPGSGCLGDICAPRCQDDSGCDAMHTCFAAKRLCTLRCQGTSDCVTPFVCVAYACLPPGEVPTTEGEGRPAEGEGVLPVEGEGVEGEGIAEGEGAVEGEVVEGEGEEGCPAVCILPHAEESACVANRCQPLVCEKGYYNVDEIGANGCEYECSITNGGMDICDNLDNDCDSEIDNYKNFDSDPANCGGCGHQCPGVPHADAACRNSQCAYVCQAGAFDVDGLAANGCESANCVPSHGGVEACDGLDNDCDGQVDEDFDKGSAATCGAFCDNCQAKFHITQQVRCENGRCVMVGCKEGYEDRNDNPADGCECLLSGDKKEICDGLDNDCDPLTPDGKDDVKVGKACATGLSGDCGPGVNRCEGGALKCLPETVTGESCDGVDNDCDGQVDNGSNLCAADEYCVNGGCTPNCEPKCQGKQCGDDGCRGSCGECTPDEICNVEGQCQCLPKCQGRQCGIDSCGGTCGECVPPYYCSAEFQCACDIQCAGKQCGADGCGGVCGTCAAQQICYPEGTCCTPDCTGKSCGDDGCGNICGSCQSGQVCLAAGTCCTVQCLNKECGDDQCEGQCGDCGTDGYCYDQKALCFSPHSWRYGADDKVTHDYGAKELCNSTTQFTAELWFKADGSGSLKGQLLSKMSNSITYADFSIRLLKDSVYADAYATDIDGFPAPIVLHTTYTANQWHHVAIQCSNAGFELYLDGVKKASSTTDPEGYATARMITVGKENNNYKAAWGYIDEIRLSKIKRYSATFTPTKQFSTDANAILLWHFDRGEGTTEYDFTTNGRNGTIQGGSWAWDTDVP